MELTLKNLCNIAEDSLKCKANGYFAHLTVMSSVIVLLKGFFNLLSTNKMSQKSFLRWGGGGGGGGGGGKNNNFWIVYFKSFYFMRIDQS